MQIYLIINNYNMSNNVHPYYYIGSDSKDRIEYMSSSMYVKADIKNLGRQNFEKFVLWKGTLEEVISLGFVSLTDMENMFHVKFDVIHNSEFYNKATANGKFHTVGRANYRYPSSAGVVNLPVNHPDVLAGIVTGMNKGNTFSMSTESNNQRTQTSLARYGTDHPCKSDSIREKLRKPKQNKENYKYPKSESHKINMRKPKSEEHKQKLSKSHRNNTEIDQYSLDGVLIRSYTSITEAALEIYPTMKIHNSRSYIGKMCRNVNTNNLGDFIWKYKLKE